MALRLSSCSPFGHARANAPPRNTSSKFTFCLTQWSRLLRLHSQSSLGISTAIQDGTAIMGPKTTLPPSRDFANWEWKVPITHSLESLKEQNDTQPFGLGRTSA